MYVFDVTIPLTLEQKNYYNENLKTDKTVLEFDHDGTIDGVQYRLFNDKDNYKLEFYQMKALDRIECSHNVSILVDKILKIASFLIQINYQDQHSTHLRLIYNSSEIIYDEEPIIDTSDTDEIPDDLYVNTHIDIQHFVYITTRQKIDLGSLDEVRLKHTDPNFYFILDCYYRALASTDYITKYYNAFGPIELIEEQYKDKITHLTSPFFSSHDISEFKTIIKGLLYKDQKNQQFSKDDPAKCEKNCKDKIYSSICNSLNATLESRAFKLELLLTEYFKITNVKSGILQYDISSRKMKEFIKTRNDLFHSNKNISAEDPSHKKLCLELMILIKTILNSMIELNDTNPVD